MKFWTTKNSNFLLKSVSFCRKNSHNFFDTNYKYINLLHISYYDKVSKYGIAKIGDFGRFGRLEFLCNKMFSDWHQHLEVLLEFRFVKFSQDLFAYCGPNSIYLDMIIKANF